MALDDNRLFFLGSLSLELTDPPYSRVHGARARACCLREQLLPGGGGASLRAHGQPEPSGDDRDADGNRRDVRLGDGTSHRQSRGRRQGPLVAVQRTLQREGGRPHPVRGRRPGASEGVVLAEGFFVAYVNAVQQQKATFEEPCWL